MAQEEMRVKKSRVKVSTQEAKSIFPFFLQSLSSYFRPCGDNEGRGFVNIFFWYSAAAISLFMARILIIWGLICFRKKENTQ